MSASRARRNHAVAAVGIVNVSFPSPRGQRQPNSCHRSSRPTLAVARTPPRPGKARHLAPMAPLSVQLVRLALAVPSRRPQSPSLRHRGARNRRRRRRRRRRQRVVPPRPASASARSPSPASTPRHARPSRTPPRPPALDLGADPASLAVRPVSDPLVIARRARNPLRGAVASAARPCRRRRHRHIIAAVVVPSASSSVVSRRRRQRQPAHRDGLPHSRSPS